MVTLGILAQATTAVLLCSHHTLRQALQSSKLVWQKGKVPLWPIIHPHMKGFGDLKKATFWLIKLPLQPVEMIFFSIQLANKEQLSSKTRTSFYYWDNPQVKSLKERQVLVWWSISCIAHRNVQHGSEEWWRKVSPHTSNMGEGEQGGKVESGKPKNYSSTQMVLMPWNPSGPQLALVLWHPSNSTELAQKLLPIRNSPGNSCLYN